MSQEKNNNMSNKVEITPEFEQPNKEDHHFKKLLEEHSADKEPSANRELLADKNGGLHTATIAEVDDQGNPWIMIDDQQSSQTKLRAQFLCPATQLRINAQCAVMFQAGQSTMPVIMGVFQNPIIALTGDISKQSQDTKKIEANKSIMISCGKASIALSQDGRVEIRGTAVVQHSTGLNRIRGASVKIN